MTTVTSVSINFSDGTKEILGTTNNGFIICEALHAARCNRPIFSVSAAYGGYQVQVLVPGTTFHKYVSGYRNGEFKWCSDYLYAKNFTLKTATKHVLELYGLK